MSDPKQVSQSTEDLKQETADLNWEILAVHLEAFLEQWEANGFGPLIADHLPAATG